MSIFRRLSLGLMGGSSSSSADTDEAPRSPHRHRHSLHRAQKNYDVSPTGGNRPISITADPRVKFAPDVPPRDPAHTLDAHQHHHRSSHHRSDGSERPRRHRSRSDADPAPRKRSRSRRRRSEIPADLEPVSPIEVLAPPSAPIPISAHAINSNRFSGSPPSGSSMGIIISGHRHRRGSSGVCSSPACPALHVLTPL